ncbi:MAG: hypothetical protein FD174_1508 [Geobacteraceae bacterium]|nr:MAG: hypothetical protein FD174_1508 [Geobacteraceae bacterium]
MQHRFATDIFSPYLTKIYTLLIPKSTRTRYAAAKKEPLTTCKFSCLLTIMKKEFKKTEKAAESDKLKSGQIIDIAVSALDEEGYGVGDYEGMPVLATGVLPGEEARVKVTFTGRRVSFAETVKILRHTPSRLKTPPCDKAAICDGCPLIQMKYPAQLAWKTELVERKIRRYRSLSKAEIHHTIPSPKPLHYRNSAKLVVAGKFAAPLIGIYRRNSHEVIDIGNCPLHHPLINKVVQAVKEGIKKGKVPIYSARTGNGILRYLVVRISEMENRAMVILVTAQRSYNEIHHLAKHLQSVVPEASIIAQNVNGSAGNAILGEKDYFITKERAFMDSVGPIRFSISPRSFFQVNGGGAQIIYEKVREWGELTGREAVIDLYCGIGGISLYLATGAKDVLGIEAVTAAVTDAENNARINGIRNCRFEAGDAAELLSRIQEKQDKFDLIVLNPPRKGCDERVLASVASLAPARVIYVSCSPQTLARDLDILSGHGYRTLEIQPVDMFPQTPHVENVALLVKD